MRPRNTAALAALVAILGAYIYFFERQREAPGKSEKLLVFKAEEAQAIVLNYPELEIRLQRDPQGQWRIVRPLEAAADDAAVGAVLSALRASEIKRAVHEAPSPADLRKYGLDRPEVKILITLRDGAALPPVALGARAPVGDSLYLRRGADPAVLLADASPLASLKEKDLYSRLSKQLADFLEEEKK